jgi:hypothetical protein
VGLIRTGALVLLLVAGSHPAAASAQQNDWVFGSQGVTVDVSEADGSATVGATIYLVPEDPTRPADPDASLTIELLVFGDVRISDLRRANGDRVLMWPASGRRFMATVGPPFLREGAPYIGLTYTVEGAVTGDGTARHVRVPMISGPVRASGEEDEGPAGSGFNAMVGVPNGWRVTESFPTGLSRGGSVRDDGTGNAEGAGVHRVELPVTPAMVAFRASTDGRWHPGFPLVIDVLTVVLLLGFAAFGWRHLQGVVSGRRAEAEAAP